MKVRKSNQSKVKAGFKTPELLKPDELLNILLRASPEEQMTIMKPLKEMAKNQEKALEIKRLLDAPLPHLEFEKIKSVDGITVLSLMAIMDAEAISKAQSIRAKKDRKRKPTKSELLLYLEKFQLERGTKRGALKAASIDFGISRPTIDKILDEEK